MDCRTFLPNNSERAEMKRRGFFGLMAGAAVAGPSMVKEAVASTTADLRIPGVGLQTIYDGMSGGPIGSADGGSMWAVKELAKLTTMGAEALARKRRSTGVDMLDPDLAVMRSLSLTAKMSLQRDRNFARQFENEKHWLQRQIEESIGL